MAVGRHEYLLFTSNLFFFIRAEKVIFRFNDAMKVSLYANHFPKVVAGSLPCRYSGRCQNTGNSVGVSDGVCVGVSDGNDGTTAILTEMDDDHR